MRDNTLRTAPFFPRLAAWLLDRLILGILLFVPRVAAAFGKMGSEPLSRAFLFRYSVEDIVFWALCAAYFVIMTAVSGATIGKKAMGWGSPLSSALWSYWAVRLPVKARQGRAQR